MLYLRRIPASVQLQLQNVWRGVPPLSHTCAHLAHSRYDLSAPHLTHQLYFFCTSFLPTFFVPSTYRASTDDEIHHHHPRWDSQFGMIIYRLLQLCVCISSLYTTPNLHTRALLIRVTHTLPEETKLAIGWDLYRSSVIIWILSFDTLLFYHICLGFICRPGRGVYNPETLHHTPHE